MNRLVSWLLPGLVLILLAALVFILSASGEEARQERGQTSQLQGVNAAVVIPGKLDFAGEAVPLSYFWVMEGLDRELLINAYWHSSTIMLMKRANRYFPVIEPILKENGVPDDFKYLAAIESNLLPAVSPAGAAGIWQFLKKTAPAYGLVVNDEVDERYHLEKATRAACAYLKEAKDTFGSWTLAAAAYNMGMGGLRKSMTEQKGTSYYDLWLNTETSRYVHRILAIKCIFENPTTYGFYLEPGDLYVPARVRHETVHTAIEDLAVYAASKGISYRALKELNPWMRSKKLPSPHGRPYQIALPEEAGRWYPR